MRGDGDVHRAVHPQGPGAVLRVPRADLGGHAGVRRRGRGLLRGQGHDGQLQQLVEAGLGASRVLVGWPGSGHRKWDMSRFPRWGDLKLIKDVDKHHLGLGVLTRRREEWHSLH